MQLRSWIGWSLLTLAAATPGRGEPEIKEWIQADRAIAEWATSSEIGGGAFHVVAETPKNYRGSTGAVKIVTSSGDSHVDTFARYYVADMYHRMPSLKEMAKSKIMTFPIALPSRKSMYAAGKDWNLPLPAIGTGYNIGGVGVFRLSTDDKGKVKKVAILRGSKSNYADQEIADWYEHRASGPPNSTYDHVLTMSMRFRAEHSSGGGGDSATGGGMR